MKVACSKPETVPRQKIRFTTLQGFYDNTSFFQVDSYVNTALKLRTLSCLPTSQCGTAVIEAHLRQSCALQLSNEVWLLKKQLLFPRTLDKVNIPTVEGIDGTKAGRVQGQATGRECCQKPKDCGSAEPGRKSRCSAWNRSNKGRREGGTHRRLPPGFSSKGETIFMFTVASRFYHIIFVKLKCSKQHGESDKAAISSIYLQTADESLLLFIHLTL